MPTFVICAETDSDELQETIKKKFDENYYILRDGSQWVVDAEKTTKEVYDEIDAGEKLGIGVVVFSIGAHSGWHDTAFWEWMELD